MSPGYPQYPFLLTESLTEQPHVRAPKILITLQQYSLLTTLVKQQRVGNPRPASHECFGGSRSVLKAASLAFLFGVNWRA